MNAAEKAIMSGWWVTRPYAIHTLWLAMPYIHPVHGLSPEIHRPSTDTAAANHDLRGADGTTFVLHREPLGNACGDCPARTEVRRRQRHVVDQLADMRELRTRAGPDSRRAGMNIT